MTILTLIVRFLRRLVRAIKRHRLSLTATLFATSVTLNSILFYIVEVVQGPQKDLTFFHCLYWAIVTMTTVGYGDIVPRTSLGRIIALETIILGIVAFTLFISTVAEFFVTHTLRRYMGLGVSRVRRADVIVVGYNEICRETVNEIKRNAKELNIVWIMDRRPRTPPEDIDYIVGDPTEEHTLLRAGIRKAKSLIVCLLNDARALHVVLMAKRLNRDLNIITLASTKKTQELLKEAGANVVVPLRVVGRALATALFGEGISQMLETVAEATVGTEIIEIPVDSTTDGKTVDDVVKSLEDRDRKHRYLPMMVSREGRITTIRSGDRVHRGDKVLILKTKKEKEE